MPKHYDKITSPAREKYTAPPKVETMAPGIWAGSPKPGPGIGSLVAKTPGGAAMPGPKGPAPKIKV